MLNLQKYRFLSNRVNNSQDLDWRYNEAHHGKRPMDGIEGAVEKMQIFVKFGEVKISNPKEFEQYIREPYQQSTLVVLAS